MLSRAQRLGPSHFVVFVQTGKTWEVVQACCNKKDFLYLSLQRLNTANHITTVGKGDFLSPVPKGSGLFLSLFLRPVLPSGSQQTRGPKRETSLAWKGAILLLCSMSGLLAGGEGSAPSRGCARTTHSNYLDVHPSLAGNSGKLKLWGQVQRLRGHRSGTDRFAAAGTVNCQKVSEEQQREDA